MAHRKGKKAHYILAGDTHLVIVENDKAIRYCPTAAADLLDLAQNDSSPNNGCASRAISLLRVRSTVQLAALATNLAVDGYAPLDQSGGRWTGLVLQP